MLSFTCSNIPFDFVAEHPLFRALAHHDTDDALHCDWLDARDAGDQHGMRCASILLRRGVLATRALDAHIVSDYLHSSTWDDGTPVSTTLVTEQELDQNSPEWDIDPYEGRDPGDTIVGDAFAVDASPLDPANAW